MELKLEELTVEETLELAKKVPSANWIRGEGAIGYIGQIEGILVHLGKESGDKRDNIRVDYKGHKLGAYIIKEDHHKHLFEEIYLFAIHSTLESQKIEGFQKARKLLK
jgi:hypothetical protein